MIIPETEDLKTSATGIFNCNRPNYSRPNLQTVLFLNFEPYRRSKLIQRLTPFPLLKLKQMPSVLSRHIYDFTWRRFYANNVFQYISLINAHIFPPFSVLYHLRLTISVVSTFKFVQMRPFLYLSSLIYLQAGTRQELGRNPTVLLTPSRRTVDLYLRNIDCRYISI